VEEEDMDGVRVESVEREEGCWDGGIIVFKKRESARRPHIHLFFLIYGSEIRGYYI